MQQVCLADDDRTDSFNLALTVYEFRWEAHWTPTMTTLTVS